MIGVLVAIALSTAGFQSDGDRRVVALVNTGDTGFVLPLDTAKRTGDFWRGELIAIQSLAEGFTVVRSDVDVEIDCLQSRARLSRPRSYGHDGTLIENRTPIEPQWESVDGDAWPVLQIMYAIACEPIDLTDRSRTLDEAAKRIRERIKDF